MPFPTLTFPQVLENATRAEFEAFLSLLVGWLRAQHKDDGSHGAITADSVAVSGAVTIGTTLAVVGTGSFNDNVTADADGNPVIIGSFGSTDAGFDATAGSGVASSHWRIVAKNGTGPGHRLEFRDMRDSSRSVQFYFADSAVGSGVVNYSMLPVANVDLNFGEDAAGKRLGEANFSIIRSDNGLYERRRTLAIGEWTTPTYAAGNYTASAGTWTLPNGAAQVTYAYAVIGKLMTVMFEIEGTSVSAAPGTLGLAIPGGFTAAKKTRALFQAIDKGTAGTGVARVDAAGTVINFQASIAGAGWTTTAANDTSVRGQMTFEIQ